jgi:hypothetical protein
MREEKARRQYRKVLPKVEKKLLQLLTEYRAANERDFEWDGRPYVERLADVAVEPTAQKTAPKKGKTPPAKGATLPPGPRKFVRNENCEHEPLTFRGRP